MLPYLISLLGVITVNLTLKTFKIDISHIEWDYSDVEIFKLESNKRYRLKARGVTPYNYAMAEGNNLVWYVENQDGSEEPYARIDEENGVYYLVPLAEGMVNLICENEKGTVTRRTTAIIYLNSVIVIRTSVQSSQNNIDPKIYYGQYDLANGQKTPAKIDFNITCVPESVGENLTVSSSTSNLNIDLKSQRVSITGDGPASFTLTGGSVADNTKTSSQYSFEVVRDGVNVYTYDDLLHCTNRSTTGGEIVVLRKSFESLKNAYAYDDGGKIRLENGAPVKKSNNVEAFGNYNAKNDKYSFAQEVYRFETTYNQEYIKQWNEFAKNETHYREISNLLNVGIHVQKDFYGNGYTLNLHNLTYPYSSMQGTDAETGETVSFAYLRDDNLFRGPLPFYALGDPNGMPLVKAYGQDNIGMYVDGDNITVNDVNLKNCDFGNSFSNLDYTGTVLEVYGDSVTICNSVLQNGKNVMRAYSSDNTVLENCMLQNARNFLLTVGCNEYIPIDGSKTYAFGSDGTMSLDEYLAEDGAGNNLRGSYLLGSTSLKQLMNIQSALNGAGYYGELPSGGSIDVKDTLFYRSGISSIALDSYFNGPFLYNSSPTMLKMVFDLLNQSNGESTPLFPMMPKNISGISYPVQVNVSGKTDFYDYKTVDEMDLSGLIQENISTFIQENRVFFEENLKSLTGKDIKIKENWSIDDIFPLKTMLYQTAATNGEVYTKDGQAYINTPVAFYGGSLNRSTVTFDGMNSAENLNPKFEVKWIEQYLKAASDGLDGFVQSAMQKTVTVVTGFESFQFVCAKGNGYLFGQAPRVSTLQSNLKG